jgi:hypothetical protein
MFCALQDCAVVMERTNHNASPQVLKDAFDKEICGYLNEQVDMKLNRVIQSQTANYLHLCLLFLEVKF